MDTADAAMEKQRVLSALVQEINETPSAVGGRKTTIPTPPQVFWAIVNSLPRLPALPTILRPPTAATAAAEVKHPGAEAFEEEEEVIVAPAEVEEFPSPQRESIRLYYE